MTVSPEYMRDKLHQWHPDWKSIDIWPKDKLTSIYRKEQSKIIEMLLSGHSDQKQLTK